MNPSMRRGRSKRGRKVQSDFAVSRRNRSSSIPLHAWFHCFYWVRPLLGHATLLPHTPSKSSPTTSNTNSTTTMKLVLVLAISLRLLQLTMGGKQAGNLRLRGGSRVVPSSPPPPKLTRRRPLMESNVKAVRVVDPFTKQEVALECDRFGFCSYCLDPNVGWYYEIETVYHDDDHSNVHHQQVQLLYSVSAPEWTELELEQSDRIYQTTEVHLPLPGDILFLKVTSNESSGLHRIVVKDCSSRTTTTSE